MADIVVLDTTQLLDTNGTDSIKRFYGMVKLGEVFNKNFKNPLLTDEQIVNDTIREIIGLGPTFVVTYLDSANVLSVKSIPKNKYFFNPPSAPVAVLQLKAVRDKKENADGEMFDRMNIAVPEGNNDLLAPGNYLSKVITDLGAGDSEDRRKYLLGTITFRRCR